MFSMSKTMIHLCVFAFLLFPASAEDLEGLIRRDENPEAIARTSLESLSWMAGSWRAEAFGGTVEELWAPPAGGQMVGLFRLFTSEKVNFYEIIALLPVEGRLTMRLKHFHADLRGWEEKDETVDFPLLDQEGEFWYFRGLTIHQESSEKMNVYLRMRRQGQVEIVPFRFKRIG
jgi:hypothetical protein